MPMAGSQLSFPITEPPAPGRMIQVAEGICWARLPLPFRLDHVNIYLIEDVGGWTVIDTGAFDPVCVGGWEALLGGPLAGHRIKRVVATHFHPDHIGLAGWLCERHGAVLATTDTCLRATRRLLAAGDPAASDRKDYYLRAGMDACLAASVEPETSGYARTVVPLPQAIEMVADGATLEIGGRRLRAIFGNGHADDQLMLYDADAAMLFAADQVIARITPYVGVNPANADADTLGQFLETTRGLPHAVSDTALVMPGHELPFHGLAARCHELLQHHAERCRRILDACAARHCSVADLVPLLFTRPLDRTTLSFAFGEARAHINFMVARGLLTHVADEDGIERFLSRGSQDALEAALWGAERLALR